MIHRLYLPMRILTLSFGKAEAEPGAGWALTDSEAIAWLNEQVGLKWDGPFVARRILSHDEYLRELVARKLPPSPEAYYAITQPYILFLNEEDAALFKLTWC